MATYTETKTTLDEIATRTTANIKRDQAAYNQLLTAQADLAAMVSAYSGFGSQLDIDAAANPSDPAWQAAKAEKDQMITDFQAEKTRIDALIVAFESV